MGKPRKKFWKPKPAQVYIIPTRFGVIYGLLIVVMFMAASSYMNNLVYLLTFVSLTVYLAALIQTNFNLKGVTVRSVQVDGGHVGDTFQSLIYVHNTTSEAKMSIMCVPSLPGVKINDRAFVPVVGANAQASTTLMVEGVKRGRHQAQRAKLWTVYPLGLWRSWTWVDVESSYYVYPERKGSQPLPQMAESQGDSDVGSMGGSDFAEHRLFRIGDSFRHVDWRAHARRQVMLVKRFDGGDMGVRILRWEDVHTPDAEQRLSQISQWVEQCLRQREGFALQLPAQKIPPAIGESHGRRCLEVLAAHESRTQKTG